VIFRSLLLRERRGFGMGQSSTVLDLIFQAYQNLRGPAQAITCQILAQFLRPLLVGAAEI